jgi:hypothetical protein
VLSNHRSAEPIDKEQRGTAGENVSATTRGFQAVTWNRNANDLFAGKWLRAPATTEIAPHTPMTGITAKVLSDEGSCTEAAGLRQPAQNCTRDWKSCARQASCSGIGRDQTGTTHWKSAPVKAFLSEQ